MRLARLQQARGERPTGEVVVPGVLTWDELQERLATWDPVRICVGVHGRFWIGPNTLLFPPDWLNLAHERWRTLKARGRRGGGALGIDPAEGGDMTSMAAADLLGLQELRSEQTPDTSVIKGRVVAFAHEWGIDPLNWVFDRGGGGYQLACDLRAAGHAGVRAVGFGESPHLEPHRGLVPIEQRREVMAERYVYLNLRAQMYGELSLLLDPSRPDDTGQPAFALPPPEAGPQYAELRRQLAVMPRLTDGEGRLWLPPKSKRDGRDTRQTLTEILGRSPDEADALALAVHGLLHKGKRQRAWVR